MKEKFEKRVKYYEEQLQEEYKVYGRIANRRLLVLVLSVVMTYLLFTKVSHIAMFIVTVIAYGMFIYLIRKHGKIKARIDRYESMKAINEKYLMRLSDEWKAFKDTGEELLDYNHPYAYDLDILGHGSLFQKINTTHTWYGRKRLKEVLLENKLTEKELVDRQKAIKELIHDLDFCQSIEGVMSKGRNVQQDAKRLVSYATEERHFFKGRNGEKIVAAIPWLVLASIGIGYILNSTPMWIIGGVLMILNYLYQVFYLGKISEAKGMLTAVMYDLTTYKLILEVLHDKKFNSPYLQNIIGQLNDDTHDALEGIKAIEKLGSKAHIAYQPIVAIPLNAIWLWDLKVVLELEKWQKKYGTYLESWLLAIGEIESLVSLSVLGHIEDISFPLVEGEGKYVEASELGHPLISTSHRVCNDVKLKEKIFVITGSNMSGKTTFLRTMGINLVLAYAGAPVVAKRMLCSQMGIYTSMRIRDDLSNGISTFYAELTRIKMIVDAAREEEQMIFLIDEIFRGTNSIDRIIGAKSVVSGLLKKGAIGAITTHDLELCHLEDNQSVMNYHFTESYTEEAIQFDYKLKMGQSTTTNARYLMKMVGIDILEQ